MKEDSIKFYKAGFGRNGEPAKRPVGPKGRLTVSQDKVLLLFKLDDTPKTMSDALIEYRAVWPAESFNEQQMSRDLNDLKLNGFLDAKVAKPALTNKQTQSYAYRAKMTFSLSVAAKTGKVKVDKDRWLVVNDKYVTDYKTQARFMAREKMPKNIHRYSLPKTPLHLLLEADRK